MRIRPDVDIMLELFGRAGQRGGQPPAACTQASTADAAPARSPEVVNTRAATFGGLPSAAPRATNRQPHRQRPPSAEGPASTKRSKQPHAHTNPCNIGLLERRSRHSFGQK
jgi:hypothetical protein